MVLEIDLEIESLVEAININGYKSIMIQLPAGLKPKAKDIQMELLKSFPDLEVTFWAGDCFGACDTPQVKGFDLFVAFGHSKWKY